MSNNSYIIYIYICMTCCIILAQIIQNIVICIVVVELIYIEPCVTYCCYHACVFRNLVGREDARAQPRHGPEQIYTKCECQAAAGSRKWKRKLLDVWLGAKRIGCVTRRKKETQAPGCVGCVCVGCVCHRFGRYNKAEKCIMQGGPEKGYPI